MVSKPRVALAVAFALALLVVTPAGSALVAPLLTGPDDGTTVDALPPFKWNAVTGADKYQFELAADANFNSPIYSASTKNTRAALKVVQPNGTYYWRVQAITSTGGLGAWSETRSLDLAWTARPSLLSPAHLATISYPADALKLTWSAVPGAAKYQVRIATDPALGSLVWSEPIETSATNFALNTPLAPGTYYWGITPLDAEGHAGTASTTASFTWEWPSETTPDLSDLVADDELYDPQLSWDPVPGAAGYEVEINFSSDWATSSKVCCDPIGYFTEASTLGSTLSPEVVLDNNTYYWRVRALDASGNAGVWNEGPSFVKTFDNVPPVSLQSIQNLHMRDNLGDPAADTNSGTAVLDTDTPVVAWDPVPGASGYQVNVAVYSSGSCDWATAPWLKVTAATAWTPLGWSRTTGSPYPSSISISTDLITALVAGQEYCVRVRAIDRPSATSGPTVFGDWTYLPANNQSAFRWNGPPPAGICSPCSMTGSDYVTPLTGTTVGRMPLFTWTAYPGAQSYYVLVSRDASFTTIIDYAYTRIPAYAPRTGTQSKGYADETTLYYWAVLPAANGNGSGVSAEPLTSGPQSFKKQSAPPSLVGPVADAVVNTPATTFQWTPAEGARRYRIQVAQDASFSAPLEDQVTDSTAYTSNTTYPSDTKLYWRVRADAENGSTFVGLTWSANGTFKKQLPRPTWDQDNPGTGAGIPALSWSPVPGAVSYDIHVEEADGDQRDYAGFPTHAVSWEKWTGVGVTKVWVRANFPTDSTSVVHGPYSSDFWQYTHTIPEPANPTEEVGQNRLLLSWDPRPAADEYRVQVSTRPDFASTVENTTTQTTSYASLLSSYAYGSGGTYYWRVAMRDTDANQGDFTAARMFTLPAVSGGGSTTTTTKKFRLSGTGYPVKNRYRYVTIYVKNASTLAAVGGASVRVSGAGVALRTKSTTLAGKAVFRIKATRYPGTVTFRVSKTGYTSAYLYRKVRLP